MIASPPAWVLALSLDSGSWRCLVGLWTWADYGATGPAHVWPTREQLAERTGQSLTAVKKQLAKLTEAGLVEPADGRGWILAWSPEGPGRSLEGPQRPPAGPAPSGATQAPDGATAAPVGTQEAPSGAPVNLADLPNQAGDLAAPARDPRAERHLAIVAEQQRERDDIAASDARRLVTREVVAAVRAAGPEWALQLERDTWARALGETIGELGLTPEQVGRVLAAWDRAAEAAGGVLAVEAGGGRSSGLPTRRALWWARHRAWVAAAALPEGQARRQRASSGLGCDWAEDDAGAGRFLGRSGW